jgi:hypothetical protein
MINQIQNGVNDVKGYWDEGVCQEDHEHGEVRNTLLQACNNADKFFRDVVHHVDIPIMKKAVKLARNTNLHGQQEVVVAQQEVRHHHHADIQSSMKNANPVAIMSSNTGTKVDLIHHLVAMKLQKLGVGSVMSISANVGLEMQTLLRVVTRSMMRAVSSVVRIGSSYVEFWYES